VETTDVALINCITGQDDITITNTKYQTHYNHSSTSKPSSKPPAIHIRTDTN